MKHALLALLTIVATSAFAAAPADTATCENFAKYGAIKAYKEYVGTIQGSDGIEYDAKLVRTEGDVSEYLVSISENNEDGETWTIDYAVKVKPNGKKCDVLEVTKTAER